MDNVDSKTRSRMMAGIRNKGTQPEVLIRKKLFFLGFRYRVNYKKLPGKPDIVLPKYRVALFTHGCFWHGHECELFKIPSTRTEFWINKIDENRSRDAKILNELHALGWRICIVWECALRGKRQIDQLDDTITRIANWIRSDSVWLEVAR